VAQVEPLIRNISDTALLAAVYRARRPLVETHSFTIPLRAVSPVSAAIRVAYSIPFSNRNAWAWVARTYTFDQFIAEQCQQGVDMVHRGVFSSPSILGNDNVLYRSVPGWHARSRFGSLVRDAAVSSK
jgi:hypothetical protein